MLLSYQTITQPIVEPVTLAQAKQQLRVDFTDDDTLISMYIVAARQFCENFTNRAFFNQTVQLNLDHFPLPKFSTTLTPEARRDYPFFGSAWDYFSIRLPRPRALTVESVKFLDLNNQLVVMDPSVYFVDVTSQPARLVPQNNLFWPYTQQYLPGSIAVTYTVGSYVQAVTETINLPPQSSIVVKDSVSTSFFGLSVMNGSLGITNLGTANIATSLNGLIDSVTGTRYALSTSNGELSLVPETSSFVASPAILLTDTVTGKLYDLAVTNGSLNIIAAGSTYTPMQSPLTGVASLLDSTGAAIPFTLQNGSITFSPTSGPYTLNYYIANIPQTISMAILLLVSHWYEQRSNSTAMNLKNIPLGLEALLEMHKFHGFYFDSGN